MGDRTEFRLRLLAVVHHMAAGLSDAEWDVLHEATEDEAFDACEPWKAPRLAADAVEADEDR
jgi:hypothetical protein